MLQYDVAIIGASSAGLFAAELLAKNGKRVAVFEKAGDLSPAARTYIVTPGITRVIPDLEPALIRHKIRTFCIHAGGQQAEIQLASPDLIIERSELIEHLFQRAIKAGMEGFLGCEFLGLEIFQGNTQLRIRNKGEEKKIKVGSLIGADGVYSQVGRSAGLSRIPSVPLIQAEIDLPGNWDDSETRVWFEIEDTPYFYWLIPDKDRKAVAGLIADPQANIKQLLDEFLEKHHFQPVNYQSGQAALYSRHQKIETWVGDLRILLVGDAAGQVKVTTVGGSVTGLEGGKAAAAAILTRQPYARALKVLHRELGLHSFIRQLLNKMSADDYYLLVRAVTISVQDFLRKYDRDSMRRHFWKLIFLQPKFIFLGFKLLALSLLSRD